MTVPGYLHDEAKRQAGMCYRELAAGQLPIDDHHALDWLAVHGPTMEALTVYGGEILREDLDDYLETFCDSVRDEEAKAKAIVAAADHAEG